MTRSLLRWASTAVPLGEVAADVLGVTLATEVEDEVGVGVGDVLGSTSPSSLVDSSQKANYHSQVCCLRSVDEVI